MFTTVGYAIGDRQNPVAEFLTLVTTYPYVLMATVSGGLFAAVAISSIRMARRKLSYETWYGIHLYAYLAIALGFLHQLFVGTDFIHDPVAVALLGQPVRRDGRRSCSATASSGRSG